MCPKCCVLTVRHLFCFEAEQICSVVSQTEEGALSLLVIFGKLSSSHRDSSVKTVCTSICDNIQRVNCGSVCMLNVKTELNRLPSGHEEDRAVKSC